MPQIRPQIRPLISLNYATNLLLLEPIFNNLHLGEKVHNAASKCALGALSSRDVDQVQAVLKLDPCNHLCKHICRVICSSDFLEYNIPFIDDFPNKMKSNIDVLGATMMNLVLCQTNGTLVVAENLHVLLNNIQIPVQPEKPYSFFECFCYSHILCLSSRQSYS